MAILLRSTCILVIALGPLVSSVSAQTAPYRLVRILAKTIEINDEVTSHVDIFLSSVNAAGDAYLGRPVRPPGAMTDELVALTEQRTQRIKELDLPPFEAPVPSTSNVPSTSFHAIRAELRARNRALFSAVIELADGRALRDQLSEGVQRVQHARKAAATLSELLRKLAPFDLSKTIQFTWLELQTVVDAALSDQQSAVKAKRDEWIMKLRQRASALEGARLDLRNYLLIEEAALQGQALVSRSERDALAVRKVAVDREQEIVNVMKQKVADLQGEQADLINERNRERQRLNSRRSSLGSLQSQERMLNDELAKPYDLCPNGASFSSCDHRDLREQWNRRTNDLRLRLDGVRQSIRSVNREITDLAQRVSNLGNLIEAQQTRIDDAVAKHQARAAALRSTRAAWQRDFDDFTAREHRSRILLYADENTRDQRQLGQIETRIREVLQ